MKQLPVGPAVAYVRTSAGKSQSQIGNRFSVSFIELGRGDPQTDTLLRLLHKAGARLVIVTKAGEQVEIVRSERNEDATAK